MLKRKAFSVFKIGANEKISIYTVAVCNSPTFSKASKAASNWAPESAVVRRSDNLELSIMEELVLSDDRPERRALRVYSDTGLGEKEVDLSKILTSDFFKNDIVRYQITGELPAEPNYRLVNFVGCTLLNVSASTQRLVIVIARGEFLTRDPVDTALEEPSPNE